MKTCVIDLIKKALPVKIQQFFQQLRILLSNPIAGFHFLIHDFRQDYLALTGKVSYAHSLVLVLGLPKSGTSWVEQLLSEVPGYIQLNGSVLRSLLGTSTLAHPHDVNDAMLINSHPKNKYSFLKLHTHYSKANVTAIEKAGQHPIIIIRDIRDMMISRYNHIMNQQNHWAHATICHLDSNQGFLRSLYDINGFNGEDPINYYTQWINSWIVYSEKNPKTTMIIKYEEMNQDIHAVLKRLLAFIDISLDDESITQIIVNQKRTYSKLNQGNIESKLKRGGRLASTFYKGQIGTWQTFFDEHHKNVFKERSGNSLIMAGYESDLSW